MNAEARRSLTEVIDKSNFSTTCALGRLAFEVKADVTPSYGLDFVAMTIGFTQAEAWGIMDGWDSGWLAQERRLWSQMVGVPEYDEGFEFGRDLFARAAGAGKAEVCP